MHLRDHSIGRMMCVLIAALAENSDLEIHVFGPDGGGGGSGTEAHEAAGGDPIIEALQAGVHHWHQVRPRPIWDGATVSPREAKGR